MTESSGALSEVLARRAEREASWSPQERAIAGVWDAFKPASAPLWWALDESFKARFRDEADVILERFAGQLKDWLDAAVPSVQPGEGEA